MNEKRSFFRVHVVTVAVAVMLAALCIAVQTHWFVQRTYSPTFGSYPDKKKLIVAQHAKSEMGWPYAYRSSSSTSRFWDLKQSDIDPAELSALSNAPASSKYSLQELNALAPTLGKFLLDESAETPFSSSRRSYYDNEALNKNLAVWTLGIFAFCLALEVALRFFLRRNRQAGRIGRVALHPISLRFSLMTALIFTLVAGLLMGLLLKKVEIHAIVVATRGFKPSEESSKVLIATREYSYTSGWPEKHEEMVEKQYARRFVENVDGRGSEPLNQLRELELIHSTFSKEDIVRNFKTMSESELSRIAPTLYAETLREWTQKESNPTYRFDKDVFYRNIASCTGLALLIGILAELLQRVWRWRKGRAGQITNISASLPNSAA